MWKKETHSEKSERTVLDSAASDTRLPNMKPETAPPKPQSSPSKKTQTILSEDSTVIGEIKGNSDVNISGKFEGNVSIPNNTATIELSGTAQATISANRVVIHGTVKGNLFGSDTVHVLSTGVVEGDIKSANVILEKACTFNGSIQMLTDNPVSSPTNKPAPKETKPETSPGAGASSKPFMTQPSQKAG